MKRSEQARLRSKVVDLNQGTAETRTNPKEYFSAEHSKIHFGKDDVAQHTILRDQAGHSYEVLEKLGEGYYGGVSRGKSLHDKSRVAIKTVNINSSVEYVMNFIQDESQARDYLLQQIDIEATILKLLKRFKGSRFLESQSGEQQYVFFMRFFSGKSLEVAYKHLTPQAKFKVFKQVTKQLMKIHEAGFLHLDIYGPNVMVRKKSKLIDFGCAAKLEAGKAVSPLTGAHIPPEVIDQFDPEQAFYEFDVKADVFAFGMMLYSLKYQRLFEYKRDESLQEFIQRYRVYYKQAQDTLDTDSSEFGQLIKTMVAREPELRPDLKALKASFKALKRTACPQAQQLNLD